MSVRQRKFAAVASCCLIVLAGCNSSSTESVGYDSPEACFNGIRDAMASQDYQTAFGSVTDETQDLLAGGLVFAGSMMKAMAPMMAMGGDQAPEAVKALETITEVLEKHGLTDDKVKSVMDDIGGMAGLGAGPDPEMLGKLAGSVDDKAAFVIDMVQGFMTLEGGGMGPDPKEILDAMAQATIDNVKIDGDSATADISSPGKPTEQIDFRKTADGWKLHADITKMGAGGGGAPEMEMDMQGDFGSGEFEMEMDLDGMGDMDQAEAEEAATEEAEAEEAAAE